MSSKKGAVQKVGKRQSALMGRLSETHPEECECRRCRRKRAALARRDGHPEDES